MKFRSTKLIEGFSTVFRQEKSAPSHCSFLHGYALSFKITFEGELDHRNWVMDFGFMKSVTLVHLPGSDEKGTLDQWFKAMFDHTTLIAGDDSELSWFLRAINSKIIQGWVLPEGVGCEIFAKLVFNKLCEFVYKDTKGRVKVVSVECIENNKNSAIVCQ